MDSKIIEKFRNSTSIATTPTYSQTTPNENLVLYNGDANIHTPSNNYKTNVKIKLEWLPSPCIKIEGQIQNRVELIDKNEVRVKISDLNLDANFHLNSKRLKNNILSFSGQLSDRTWIGKRKGKVSELIFHLPNFLRFYGKPIQYKEQEKISRGRLKLQGKKWSIDIDKTHNSKSLQKELKRTGGFALTHTGKIKNIENDTFGKQKAKEVLEMLHFFLSFCKGAWVGPVLTVGRNNETKIEKWENPFLSVYKKGKKSWFPKRSIKGISDAFSVFEERWEKDFWRESFKMIIDWYINGNSASHVDKSIILTQTALEHLSWFWIVEEKRAFTTSEFKNDKSASEKIELLLNDLGISYGLPDHINEFDSISQKLRDGYPDPPNGVESITRVRNLIVHPRKAKRERLSKLTIDERYKAGQLSLLYIELILLRLLDYDGKIYNRIEGNEDRNMQTLLDFMDEEYGN